MSLKGSKRDERLNLKKKFLKIGLLGPFRYQCTSNCDPYNPWCQNEKKTGNALGFGFEVTITCNFAQVQLETGLFRSPPMSLAVLLYNMPSFISYV